MSYAIIGFGNIGQALAKAFARNGIEVSVATTRDPESFASAAAAIGPEIIPKKLAEAVKADIVFWPSVLSRTGMSRRRCRPGRERPSSM
jgi:8-hydroxy-5-deazaflavin:NADPH oxidoreductase